MCNNSFAILSSCDATQKKRNSAASYSLSRTHSALERGTSKRKCFQRNHYIRFSATFPRMQRIMAQSAKGKKLWFRSKWECFNVNFISILDRFPFLPFRHERTRPCLACIRCTRKPNKECAEIARWMRVNSSKSNKFMGKCEYEESIGQKRAAEARAISYYPYSFHSKSGKNCILSSSSLLGPATSPTNASHWYTFVRPSFSIVASIE